MLTTRKSFGSSLGVSKATWDTICKETLTVRAELKKKGQHLKWTVMQPERSQHASQFSDAFDKCVGYLAKHHLKQNNMKTGAVTDLFYPILETWKCWRICMKQPLNSQQRFIMSVQLFISLVFLLSNEKGCALSGPGRVPSEATGLNCWNMSRV